MKSLYVTFIILFGWSMVAVAKTVDLASERSTITIPESWTRQDITGAIFAAKDVESGLSILIRVTSNPHDSRYDKSRIDNIKKGISMALGANEAKIDFGDDNPIEIDGVPSFFFNFKLDVSASQTVYGRVYGIAANGKLYQIILESLSPEKNSDLNAIASSFRFDAPPELPDDSYAAGYKAGQYLLPILILAGLFFVVRKLIYRKSGKS